MKIGVVAHVSRQAQAEALRDAVDADAYNLDDGTLGCEGNHASVLADLCALVEPEDDWVVVLEDDVQLCPDFISNLNSALSVAPAPLVALYLGTGNPSGPVQRAVPPAIDLATRTQSSWLISDVAIPCVAYAVHAELAEELLVDVLDLDGVEWPLRVSRWAQWHGYPCSYAHPSLVQHRDQQSAISPTADMRFRQPRRAHKVVGARGAYWNAKTVPIDLRNCAPWSDRTPVPGATLVPEHVVDVPAVPGAGGVPPAVSDVQTPAAKQPVAQQ